MSFPAGEVERISKLALWGREFLKDKSRTRAPIVVLTGTEVFTRFSLRDAREEAGEKHADFAKAGMFRSENLRMLADATQQLYLGLPPYHSWLEEKWRKRRGRQARTAQPPAETSSPPERELPSPPNG